METFSDVSYIMPFLAGRKLIYYSADQIREALGTRLLDDLPPCLLPHDSSKRKRSVSDGHSNEQSAKRFDPVRHAADLEREGQTVPLHSPGLGSNREGGVDTELTSTLDDQESCNPGGILAARSINSTQRDYDDVGDSTVEEHQDSLVEGGASQSSADADVGGVDNGSDFGPVFCGKPSVEGSALPSQYVYDSEQDSGWLANAFKVDDMFENGTREWFQFVV